MLLDLLGYVPVVGIAADAYNAYLYTVEGDIARALLSAGVVVANFAGSAWAVKDVATDVVFRFSPDAGRLLDDVADPVVDQVVRQGILAYLDEAAGISDNIKDAVKYKVIKVSSADEVNDWWRIEKGYDNPPYLPGSTVTEIELLEDTVFVRVYDGIVSKQAGGWIMKTEDIAGLTAVQIQDKFALPALPRYITDVHLPAGSRLRIGIANSLDGWGNGGGTQLDLMDQRIGEFTDSRPLS